MGWKDAIRSIGAAVRAAEREAKRKHRELERLRKDYERMHEVERAAYEVEVHQNYIDRLLSIHKESGEHVDWRYLVSAQPPEKPVRSSAHEAHARQDLINYRPSLWDRLSSRGEDKRLLLVQAVERAKETDEKAYRQAVEQYERQSPHWEENRALAQRIIDGDSSAYIEAIKEFDPFSEMSDLGSKVSFAIYDDKLIGAVLHVHGQDVIPKVSKSLLNSGRVAIEEIPKGEFNQVLHDYVCGCTLRIARELFALLPVDEVIVTAMDTLLNLQTGHLKEQPILSVGISRNTLKRLDLDEIDPSDSIRNFIHRMTFRKMSGFSAIEPIKASEIILE